MTQKFGCINRIPYHLRELNPERLKVIKKRFIFSPPTLISQIDVMPLQTLRGSDYM